MKKLLCALLVALLAFSTVGALAEEKVNLTAFQYELDNQDIDFGNLWYFKMIEEETGVHVDFREIKDNDWTTQVNLMFASGEYEDMILRGTIDIEEYGVAQQLLLPLDDLIPQYMPNYSERMDLNQASASIPASDGKTYYLGFLMAQNVNHEGTWYINQTWLDNLGLEVPTTVDELTEVLRAFKTRDPNGNGVADEIPFSADFVSKNMTQTLWCQFAMFGVPENLYFVFIDEDEKVQFTGYQEGWREAIEWMHLIYNEGLMDEEVFTQDSNLWGAKMNDGRVGYTCYLRLINTALTPETAANFHSILPPVAEGREAKVSSILEVPDQGARLTVTNSNVEASLKWLDAQFETENMMMASNGPIGGDGPIADTMHINEEGKYVIDYIPENNGLYQIVPVTCGQFFAPGDYYTAIYQMAPHRVERYQDSLWYAEEDVLEYKSFHYLWKLSVAKMTNEDAIERERLYNDLDKFMRDSITDFIINGITDAQYDEFIKTLGDIGADRYVEIYQNAYDAYLAANE